MTSPGSTMPPAYLDTLLRYYEEEISGEAYFYGLASFYQETEKVNLLAEIERKAAATVEPLLRKYGLVPAATEQLRRIGERHLSGHRGMSWNGFMEHIVQRYPLYLDEFHALEAMAPAEDLPDLQRMSAHEVAVIEFAERELEGSAQSTQPLRQYLSQG